MKDDHGGPLLHTICDHDKEEEAKIVIDMCGIQAVSALDDKGDLVKSSFSFS